MGAEQAGKKIKNGRREMMIREVVNLVSITSILLEGSPSSACTARLTDLIDTSVPRRNVVFDESPRRTERLTDARSNQAMTNQVETHMAYATKTEPSVNAFRRGVQAAGQFY